jgi:hypothetical protein
MVPAVCESCGSAFKARRCSVVNGDGRFCSRGCMYDWRGRETISQRFWRRVVKTDGCWFYPNADRPERYGIVTQRGLKQIHHRANRLSWELHYGPIPDGLWVLHRCDVPACVRPDHLFLGNRSDNMRDAAQKKRLNMQREPGRFRDLNRSRSPLSLDSVASIRARYAAGGITLKALGDEHGVTKYAIWRIVHGRNWKDVATCRA